MKSANSFLLAAILAISPMAAQAKIIRTLGEQNLNVLIPDEEFIERYENLSGFRYGGPFEVEVSFKVVPKPNSAGMWNGDYSAYLVHTTEDLSKSATAVLLNRVGRTNSLPRGYDDNGIDITLRDDAPTNVHTYRSTVGNFSIEQNLDGTFRVAGIGKPDGRLVNPLQVVDSDPSTNPLNPLGLLDPNGRWQFMIGDLEAGFEGVLDFWKVTIAQLGLVAPDNNITIQPGQDLVYPDVTYEDEGKLTVAPDSQLTIEDPALIPKKTTTVVNGTLILEEGGEAEACSIIAGSGTIVIGGSEPMRLRGRISPGNSIGTITFAGNIVLDDETCRTDLEIQSLESFDRIVVGGSVVLNNPSLQASNFNSGQMKLGDQYPFLLASGGISGNYSVIAMPEGFRGRFLLQNNNTVGTLLVAPASYTQVATTPNERRLAESLNSFIPGQITSSADCLGPLEGVARTTTPHGDDRDAVSLALDLLPAELYPAAFQQIMPGFYQSIVGIQIAQSFSQIQMMSQRLGSARIGGPRFQAIGLPEQPIKHDRDGKSVVDGKSVASAKSFIAPKEVVPINEPYLGKNWNAWVLGMGSFSRWSNSSSVSNFRNDAGGVLVGADHHWSDQFLTGVFAGYQFNKAKYSDGSSLNGNSVLFGGYATWWNDEGFYADTIVGGGFSGYKTRRSLEFSTIDRTARANPSSGLLTAALNIGKDWNLGGFSFGPIAGAQYTYIGVGSFTENGADSLDLAVNQQNANSFISTLGARIAYFWNVNKKLTLIPEVRLLWQHEFMNNSRTITSTLQGGQGASFGYVTDDPDRDSAYGGAGVTARIGDRWTASLFYNIDFGNPNFISNQVSAGLNYAF